MIFVVISKFDQKQQVLLRSIGISDAATKFRNPTDRNGVKAPTSEFMDIKLINAMVEPRDL
jgi:hypothetical protein